MNPRQNFYSSVFEQIANYKKENLQSHNHHLLHDPIVGLGLFAAILAFGVFSGYLQVPSFVNIKNTENISSILKIEERSAADIFSPDKSNASSGLDTVSNQTVLIPSEDGYVSADSPQKAFSSETYLKASKSPVKNIYFKFKIPDDNIFSKAQLRINPIDSSESGGYLSVLSDNLWSERLLTYNSQPVGEVMNIGDIGPISSRVPKFIDVTSIVKPGQTYTFKISGIGSDGVDYYSRESSSETSPALIFTE